MRQAPECSSCLHWHIADQNHKLATAYGWCRIRAPSIGGWPETHALDFCSEWTIRVKGAAEARQDGWEAYSLGKIGTEKENVCDPE